LVLDSIIFNLNINTVIDTITTPFKNLRTRK